MQKLLIEQCFEKIQTIYDQPSISWEEECVRFSLNENEPTTWQLTVWQDGVLPEQIFAIVDYLERKIEQFLLAMQLMDNERMRRRGDITIKYFAQDAQEFQISKRFPEIVDSIQKHERGEQWGFLRGGTFRTEARMLWANSPVAFPSTLPQISLKFQRLINIFSSAQDFSGPYREEHQLRNYWLILEELEKDHAPKPSAYDDLKKVRNFIIHSTCSNPETIAFIQANFPEAIVNKNGEYAQFDRTKDSHIKFISTYRDQAYFWAKE
ncbi:hypothetical protein [Methyloglobulus sp.]|uniref:hypothetical protein n=1 Tax=Methyloglobulus sp. TaxID=2518622 RepID=UPI0032B87EF4